MSSSISEVKIAFEIHFVSKKLKLGLERLQSPIKQVGSGVTQIILVI